MKDVDSVRDVHVPAETTSLTAVTATHALLFAIKEPTVDGKLNIFESTAFFETDTDTGWLIDDLSSLETSEPSTSLEPTQISAGAIIGISFGVLACLIVTVLLAWRTCGKKSAPDSCGNKDASYDNPQRHTSSQRGDPRHLLLDQCLSESDDEESFQSAASFNEEDRTSHESFCTAIANGDAEDPVSDDSYRESFWQSPPSNPSPRKRTSALMRDPSATSVSE